MEAHLHIKVLRLLGAHMQRENPLEHQLCEQQLVMKENSLHSWFIGAKKLLVLYNLPSPVQLLWQMPPKEAWRKTISECVCNHWLGALMGEA